MVRGWKYLFFLVEASKLRTTRSFLTQIFLKKKRTDDEGNLVGGRNGQTDQEATGGPQPKVTGQCGQHAAQQLYGEAKEEGRFAAPLVADHAKHVDTDHSTHVHGGQRDGRVKRFRAHKLKLRNKSDVNANFWLSFISLGATWLASIAPYLMSTLVNYSTAWSSGQID